MVNDDGDSIFDNERGCIKEAYRTQAAITVVDEEQDRQDNFEAIENIGQVVKNLENIGEIKDEERNMSNIEKQRMRGDFNLDKYKQKVKFHVGVSGQKNGPTTPTEFIQIEETEPEKVNITNLVDIAMDDKAIHNLDDIPKNDIELEQSEDTQKNFGNESVINNNFPTVMLNNSEPAALNNGPPVEPANPPKFIYHDPEP